jgi:hypothetical protein
MSSHNARKSAGNMSRVPDARPSAAKALVGILTLAILSATTVRATLPPWLQHVVGASTLESALFRAMQLPGVQALYPRPPKEAQSELANLIARTPNDAQLYALRAQTDEAALDFTSAEADWKQAIPHAQDPVSARLQLANFYHRRLAIPQEIAALNEVAAAPAIAAEKFVDLPAQRSWLAFDRILNLVADQGLPPAQVAVTFQAFLARYPAQSAVYAQCFTWQLSQQAWPDAEALIARYRRAFPQDAIFPIRAEALLDYRRGNIDAALAVYDRSFQPLWPAPLIQSYFGLLDATHRQRAFVADAHRRLAENPDGDQALNALARLFYADQQAGRLDKAQQTLDAFRIARDAGGKAWSAADLSTLAALADSIHAYAESARYNFALASVSGNVPNGEPAAQAGLAALIHLLLSVPDQPITLGSGNLSLYRDIATVDQGPGYWNGILSLWFSGSNNAQEYQSESARAQSYFHRAKAAELLRQLDQKFPNAPQRPALHAELIRTYAQYGEAAAVIAAGQHYLGEYKASPDRVAIAGLMADAYARQRNTAAEFALYDSLLAELASKAEGQPLTAGHPAQAPASDEPQHPAGGVAINPDATEDGATLPGKAAQAMRASSYQLTADRPAARTLPEAVAYAQILDRYLGRLVAEKQLPQALTVLRRQLDQSPDDPALYEKLATFLAQNNLSAQQEEVYRLAIAHFQSPGWYSKLARVYLRQRNRQAYSALTHQVADIFSGTDLDDWFRHAATAGFNSPSQPDAGAQLALELNVYAAHRFPHDQVFVHNLLAAYSTGPVANAAAYAALVRAHWWESDDLRQQFFAYLSRTGQLDAELAALGTPAANPAASRELAELQIWRSHFEAAAPLLASVAELYPADATVGDNAASLYRSLAYLDPSTASTMRAVQIETRLLAADPNDPTRLATLGDLYAEATALGGEDLRSASPFWRRIPALHPGTPAGYLTSATIFWDYFQFDDALAELTAARAKFHQPTLYGYEAGAIAENRQDLPTAIAEYTAVAIQPPGTATFIDSLNAALDAYARPPSDAADSNLQATTQSLFNAASARDRLLQLATRPATRTLVDAASARALATNPSPIALTLRADILLAQHRSADLPALLEAALFRATTVDEAAAIGDLARTHSQDSIQSDARLRVVTVTPGNPTSVGRSYAASGSYALNAIYEHALEKQIALATDPVQAIELRYTLSAALESRKDIPAATRVIDTVYRTHPRILGVVRATTDFYARTAQAPRAIATLVEASKSATPTLARTFTLEAAQKANEAGDTRQARSLAEPFLQQAPLDSTVLAILSASYARDHDNAGLKAFFLARLEAVRTAQLSSVDRKANTATLRRGLIPALTGLKDYAGATDQYIALLSAYPQDESTAQQAALYALRHARQVQLVAFLETTVKQSPRDSRFSILLGQVQTTFGDLPAAVAAYSQAIAVRKDLPAVYTARADLELRLASSGTGLSEATRLEAVAADYQRLYLLSYKDPIWMVRLGELRARQNRPVDAVAALTLAYVTGQTPTAAAQFRIADKLLEWNLLPQARSFAEQGITLAGQELLTKPDSSAATYARILTRLGKPDEALGQLTATYNTIDRAGFPPELAAAYAKSGAPAQDLANFRTNFLQTRRDTARQQLTQAVNAIGATVQTYFTPEQKLAYAQTLDQLHTGSPALALTAVTSAGLTDREAEWRSQQLLTVTRQPSQSPSQSPDQTPGWSTYATLQRRRLAFAELAQTLETLASRQPAQARPAIRIEAARAWRDSGDELNEIRITRSLVERQADQRAELMPRLFDLLLRHDRSSLVALAGSRDETLANAAANYAVAHATPAQALAAVAARARTVANPVWNNATASLVLTHFAQLDSTRPAPKKLSSALSPAAPSAEVGSTSLSPFQAALNPEATIGERLRHPADPTHQLTGDQWFYYASRFGLYLQTTHGPDPEAYLPAELERAPSAVAAYVHLARNYAETGNTNSAIAEYAHALELAADNPAVDDEFAMLLDHANRHDEALAHWHTAFTLLSKRQTGEPFFATFAGLLDHLHRRALIPAFRPDVESVLRPYLARNGNYRSNELLEALYTASPTPADGTTALLTAASYAGEPQQVLADLRGVPWLAPESSAGILLRLIELARNQPAEASESGFGANVKSYQHDLIGLYLDRNEVAKARALYDSIPAAPTGEVDAYGIVIAARSGRLHPLFEGWRDQPLTARQSGQIDDALTRLRKSTAAYTPNPVQVRLLQEFAFEQKQFAHTLVPTDYLALAQSRFETHDTAGALDVLHRLTLAPVSAQNSVPPFQETDSGRTSFGQTPAATDPSPWQNTDYAAALLESTGHDEEAVSFLGALVQSVPWNASYRLRLAEARRKSAGNLAEGSGEVGSAFVAIASDSMVPYAIRVQAAVDRASFPSKEQAPSLGSRELDLLATSPHPAAEAARQPYFAAARRAAASSPALPKETQAALLLESIAIAPGATAARLDLLLAQTSADQASATLALYNSLSGQQNVPESNATDAADARDVSEASALSSDDLTTLAREPGPTPADFPLALPATLGTAARIRLAVVLASAYGRDQNPAQALYFDQLAIHLDAADLRPGHKPDPALARRLVDLRAAQLLEARNALRRPTIHADLDQSNQVRPRLALADLLRAEAQ